MLILSLSEDTFKDAKRFAEKTLNAAIATNNFDFIINENFSAKVRLNRHSERISENEKSYTRRTNITENQSIT